MQLKVVCAAAFASTLLFTDSVFAEIEEILITARIKEERAQDVPVTVTSLSDRTAEIYELESIRDISEIVPTLVTTQRGSGAGAAIYLRGIGSDNNDAAFDSAVALNFDNVMANSSRLMTHAHLDVAQIDILKGPQSLYFGKGASAGVISIQSADPKPEFESELSLGREFEKDGWTAEAMVSGAINESLLARLAVRTSQADEVTQNTDPLASNQWRGEDFTDGRFTLLWQPYENFSANFKYSFSEYKSDGNLLFADIQCRDATPQPTIYGFQQIVLPNNYDCDFTDNRIQVADQNIIESQSQDGNNQGIPFGKQQLDIARLKLTWNLTEAIELSSVTAYLEMDDAGFECFAYDSHGSNCISNQNTEESLSQELRIQTRFEGPLNMLGGLYYQDRELFHRSVQNTFAVPYLLGVSDPFLTGQGIAAAQDHYNYTIVPGAPIFDTASGTGFTNDWTKEHPTDHKTVSAYASLSWDFLENWNLTAGGRYSDEEKDNLYNVPYIHSGFVAFSAPPFSVPSAPEGFSVASSFSDSHFSPEASLSYKPSEQSLFYLAYKTGFKSGGISTSPLPLFTTYLNLAAGDTSELIYDSETSEGFELGMKILLLDEQLRLNTTAYRYLYEDLQIQNFDPVSLAFVTLNADEVTNQGIEVDFVYLTEIEGLSLSGFLGYTDTEYSKNFINIIGANLKGEDRQQAPEWSGSLGVDYLSMLTAGLNFGLSGLLNYSDDYITNNSNTGGPNNYVQPSYWRADMAFFIFNRENTWELRLAAKNVTDEIYTTETVGRPNSIPNNLGETDMVHFQNRGRQIGLTGTYRF